MTDFRALCAELAEFVARLTKHYYEPAELLTRARAALAEPEPEGPTERQLMMLANDMGMASVGDATEYARAVLARWGSHPRSPDRSGNLKAGLTRSPVDEEVAELVEWLREQLDVCLQAPWTPGIKHFGRAANLLERLSPPQPVPVSERLPGPEDRNSVGKCWWFCFKCPGEHSYWILGEKVYCDPIYWLPAHSLPLPTAND